MPSSAEASRGGVRVEVTLVDTSAAIPFLVQGHDDHEFTYAALHSRELGLAGHAAFETYSVLTRLPPPARQDTASATRLISVNFPHSRFLTPAAAAGLLADLSAHRVAGGSVYDALVGAAAREHDLLLATRDRRALEIYRALGVRVELLA